MITFVVIAFGTWQYHREALTLIESSKNFVNEPHQWVVFTNHGGWIGKVSPNVQVIAMTNEWLDERLASEYPFEGRKEHSRATLIKSNLAWHLKQANITGTVVLIDSDCSFLKPFVRPDLKGELVGICKEKRKYDNMQTYYVEFSDRRDTKLWQDLFDKGYCRSDYPELNSGFIWIEDVNRSEVQEMFRQWHQSWLGYRGGDQTHLSMLYSTRNTQAQRIIGILPQIYNWPMGPMGFHKRNPPVGFDNVMIAHGRSAKPVFTDKRIWKEASEYAKEFLS